MNIHEYVAKNIFKQANLNTPQSYLSHSPEESAEFAREIGKPVAVKAQVLTGGRGKSGGILFADTPEEAAEKTEILFNKTIKGEKVEKVLIEEKVENKVEEYYLTVILDRDVRQPLIMASIAGGMEIEEVAKTAPEKIVKKYVNPIKEFMPYEARNIALQMGVDTSEIAKIGDIILKLYNIFNEYDATVVEINPLIKTADGEFIAADAKMAIDDDASFRHTKIKQFDEFKDDKFAYVKLDGNIAVIGNGAGLTLTAMDLIEYYGEKAATFIDIGGGAAEDIIKDALNLVLKDDDVKVIFFNMLGGITRADTVAEAIVKVREESDIHKPIVIRLTGTKEVEGQKILSDHGIPFETSMERSAIKAIEILHSLEDEE
ncbi:MAG: ADP-forming succinate--CoA ligase subunit beta [Methanosphaera sp.]|uniref:ADP-forming succinate--CoA ligase subunit beta n=1 Tax=Methanosphaera sp. TaxID=2666342 RepID=UPI0025E4900E|nr:ADP-forming succinate--CoA ligase subunit beta [Methanosphaera sp.]MCI5866914.1 ADP-forming succinate--CoA ligase subunit beta [Methanosphaera sp.]MDD6534421.1 ADP-forming succinate--CoA ligase subunit beta [Methanosphaera sp.]MDY3955174.1 ADP-forming succinate--CoA ligase subunit beta [Methanosphaera sp.]